jgi:hypothetical protein
MRARPPKPDKRSCASYDGGWLLPPPEPTPAHRDGVLRQSDVPTLPAPVPGCSFVYQLLDPITGEPRYVGRTRTPAIRRQGHRDRRSDKRSAVNEWHRRLALQGLRPVMRILDGPLPYREAARREETWRRAHLAAGFELLNAVPCVDGRHEGDAIWSERAALDEVRALARRLGLGGSYPTRRQFAESGLSGLESAVERRLGGHRTIAAQLGLAMPTPEWMLASAEHAVRKLVATLALERYPTAKEFTDSGESGLFQAITTRFGGHKAFARRLGLANPRSAWTGRSVDIAIDSVAAEVSSGVRYPTDQEMRQHGPPGLSGAARRFGGNRARAARLGLRMTRQSWAPETAATAVLALVDALSLDRYPTEKQFRDAGKSGLYCAIAGHPGGHGAMAARLQLSRAARRSK